MSLADFDRLWGEELQNLLEWDDERLSRSIANLVSTRNKVAHGASEQVRSSGRTSFRRGRSKISDWFLQRFHPGVQT